MRRGIQQSFALFLYSLICKSSVCSIFFSQYLVYDDGDVFGSWVDTIEFGAILIQVFMVEPFNDLELHQVAEFLRSIT